jgi:hypothetical protein
MGAFTLFVGGHDLENGQDVRLDVGILRDLQNGNTSTPRPDGHTGSSRTRPAVTNLGTHFHYPKLPIFSSISFITPSLLA